MPHSERWTTCTNYHILSENHLCPICTWKSYLGDSFFFVDTKVTKKGDKKTVSWSRTASRPSVLYRHWASWLHTIPTRMTYCWAKPLFWIWKLAFKIIHSTTVLLPVWQKILQDLNQKMTYMPHDVMAHWNSMFNMLNYTLLHHDGVDGSMQQWELGLRRLELTDQG